MRSDCIVRTGKGALAQKQSGLTSLWRSQCMKLLMSSKPNATEAQNHQTFVTHRLHSCLTTLTCIHDEHIDHPRPQRIIQGDKKAWNEAYGCWNDYRMIQSVICPLLRSSLANSLLLWRNCSSNMLIRLLTPCVCCSNQATTTNMYTGNGKMLTTNMKDIRLPTIGFLSQTMNALLRRMTVGTISRRKTVIV